VAFVVSVAMALLFVGTVAAALLTYLAPVQGTVRILPPGTMLGSGPYRSYACAASPDLLDGIVASVESAADGLATRDRDRLREVAMAARTPLAAGDMPEAVAAAARAIGVYRGLVEALRQDDTAHG
jgi:hypothetical protein